eukprot:632783-Lingulodinium_polyedra.AAC.1
MVNLTAPRTTSIRKSYTPVFCGCRRRTSWTLLASLPAKLGWKNAPGQNTHTAIHVHVFT